MRAAHQYTANRHRNGLSAYLNCHIVVKISLYQALDTC